jgi:hypothetical protein
MTRRYVARKPGHEGAGRRRPCALRRRRRAGRRVDADGAPRPWPGRAVAGERRRRGFSLHALDPARTVSVAGRNVAFAPTSGPPNIMDIERGRRAGTFDDFCNLMKLCQSFEAIHVLGSGVEPQDIPVHIRHLEVTRAQLPADRQGAVHLLARPPAGRRQLRAAAHRARRDRRGVCAAPVHVYGHQHQFAAAARYPDVRGHRRLRRWPASRRSSRRSRSRARWRR